VHRHDDFERDENAQFEQRFQVPEAKNKTPRVVSKTKNASQK